MVFRRLASAGSVSVAFVKEQFVRVDAWVCHVPVGFGNGSAGHKEMRLHKEILEEFIYFKGSLKQEEKNRAGLLAVSKCPNK